MNLLSSTRILLWTHHTEGSAVLVGFSVLSSQDLWGRDPADHFQLQLSWDLGQFLSRKRLS